MLKEKRVKPNTWVDNIKANAKRMSDNELMKTIDMLDGKVPKSPSEVMAINMLKVIYYNELQERIWAIK